MDEYKKKRIQKLVQEADCECRPDPATAPPARASARVRAARPRERARRIRSGARSVSR